MKTIKIRDDISATVPAVRMICDCGWEEKGFRREAVPRAANHINSRHGGNGQLAYNGEVREINNFILDKGLRLVK